MADNIFNAIQVLAHNAIGNQESKSCSTSSSQNITSCELSSLLGGYALGSRMGWQWLKAHAAWRYYKQVSSVTNGVDIAAEAFETIEPQIQDIKDETFHNLHENKIPQTKILELLNKPSSDESQISFLGSMNRSFSVVGDMFMFGKAINENSPFVDLIYINPIDMEAEPDMKGGIRFYRYYNGSGTTEFHATELEGDIRYFTTDMRWELWHTRRFNPDKSARSNSSLMGMSPLNPLYLELEQLISAKIHNWAMLENGARPSGAITLDKDVELTDPQFQRLKGQIREFYQNPSNTGNVLFIEGGKDFKELSLTNKDMDFFNLTKEDKRQVARNLKIPLPLIEGDSQTFNNFGQADAILHTRNVIPFAMLFYTEFNRFAGRRYNKNGDNRFRVWFDVRDIPAMQLVQTEITKNKGSTGFLTFDEGRAMLDLPALESGGNVVYQPSTLVPVGTASEVKNIDANTRGRFIETMKASVDINGNRQFTDEVIMREAEKKYGNSE